MDNTESESLCRIFKFDRFVWNIYRRGSINFLRVGQETLIKSDEAEITNYVPLSINNMYLIAKVKRGNRFIGLREKWHKNHHMELT